MKSCRSCEIVFCYLYAGVAAVQAIVDGLRESVLAFSHNVEGTSPKDVLDMVLVTQYFDTMKVRRGKGTYGQQGRAANAFIKQW